jgi:hypothetical protein
MKESVLEDGQLAVLNSRPLSVTSPDITVPPLCALRVFRCVYANRKMIVGKAGNTHRIKNDVKVEARKRNM